MPSRRLTAVLAVALLCLAVAPARALAAGPAAYLRAAQNTDGGFGMTASGPSTQFATGWAMLGLAAAGQRPNAAAVAYVRRGIGSLGAIGDLERTLLVVRAAGADPRSFGGHDLVTQLLRMRSRDGSFQDYVSYTAFALLALRAGGVARSAASVRGALAWLRGQQNGDGGFNVGGRGGPSGSDDTGYSLQALVAGGARTSAATRRAAAYLARTQHPDGGFALQGAAASNAQSTAYAVQGLVAAGGQPRAVSRGLAYLRSLTQPDGLVRYSRTSAQTPVWVTAQALLALSRRPFA